MTAAGFLYDSAYKTSEKDKSGRILSEHLAIGTSFSSDILQVRIIHNQKKENKGDYAKEPAILEVSYCVKGL